MTKRDETQGSALSRVRALLRMAGLLDADPLSVRNAGRRRRRAWALRSAALVRL